tara:strand:- start:916 stop:1221 length:306 start_codon:yes stop_codon:yes gene_type:complete
MTTVYNKEIDSVIRATKEVSSAVYGLPSWRTMTGKSDSSFLQVIERLSEAKILLERGRDEVEARWGETSRIETELAERHEDALRLNLKIEELETALAHQRD